MICSSGVFFLLHYYIIVAHNIRIYRYKYLPSLLKEILFPSPRTSAVDAPPPKKRRRLQDPEDVDMADAEPPSPVSPVTQDKDSLRPVILETAKESYLLSPSDESPGAYDIALVLEAEVVVEEEPAPEADASEEKEQNEDAAPVPAASEAAPVELEKAPDVESEANKDPIPSAINSPETVNKEPLPEDDAVLPPTASPPNPLPPPPTSGTTPVHSPEPLPGDDSMGPPSSPPPTDHSFAREKTPTLLTDGDIVKTQFDVQVLQRNLSVKMFRFTEEGVYVLDGSASGDGMEDEWVIQVKNWKWAPRGARERML